MARDPIRVFYSALSGRFYASAHYRIEERHAIITGRKDDVTQDIAREIVTRDIVFREVERRGEAVALPSLQFIPPTFGVVDCRGELTSEHEGTEACLSACKSARARDVETPHDAPHRVVTRSWAYTKMGDIV